MKFNGRFLNNLNPLLILGSLLLPITALNQAFADPRIDLASKSVYIAGISTNSSRGTSQSTSCQLIQPINSGYGAKGQYSVAVETFPSPLWSERNVSVFHPAQVNAASPVVFFAHGYSVTNPESYKDLIEHIVSRGFVVVHSPYRSDQGILRRYDTLFAGFEEAVKRYPQYIDASKVGFIGHSFGGGAIPAMAWRGLVDKGWGKEGAFLFPMAPWYAYEITQQQLEEFPTNTKLIMQVYYEDNYNDHRMAKDIFENINIPDSEKDYVLLYSDSFSNCQFIADHAVPRSPRTSPEIKPSKAAENGLDYYGIYRLFDALADYTFNGNVTAKNLALGNGSPEQKYMGTWPNGQPVKELEAGDNPVSTHKQSFYTYPWNSPNNPRKDVTLVRLDF